MSIEIKKDICKTISEKGIYFVELKASFGFLFIKKNIVFSRYCFDKDIVKFFKEHKYKEIGVKENLVKKQIIILKITPITYLSEVNKDTYNRWMISKENTVSNSIG